MLTPLIIIEYDGASALASCGEYYVHYPHRQIQTVCSNGKWVFVFLLSLLDCYFYGLFFFLFGSTSWHPSFEGKVCAMLALSLVLHFSAQFVLCRVARMWHSFLLRTWLMTALCMLGLSLCLHWSIISHMHANKNVHWEFWHGLHQVIINPIFAAPHLLQNTFSPAPKLLQNSFFFFWLQKLLHVINWLDHHCHWHHVVAHIDIYCTWCGNIVANLHCLMFSVLCFTVGHNMARGIVLYQISGTFIHKWKFIMGTWKKIEELKNFMCDILLHKWLEAFTTNCIQWCRSTVKAA